MSFIDKIRKHLDECKRNRVQVTKIRLTLGEFQLLCQELGMFAPEEFPKVKMWFDGYEIVEKKPFLSLEVVRLVLDSIEKDL